MVWQDYSKLNTLQGNKFRPYPTEREVRIPEDQMVPSRLAAQRLQGATPEAGHRDVVSYLLGKVVLDVQRLRSTYSPFVNQQKSEMSLFWDENNMGHLHVFSSWICMFFLQPMKIWLHSAIKGLHASLFLLGNTNSLSLFLRGV